MKCLRFFHQLLGQASVFPRFLASLSILACYDLRIAPLFSFCDFVNIFEVCRSVRSLIIVIKRLRFLISSVATINRNNRLIS